MGKIIGEFCEQNKLIQIKNSDHDAFEQLKLDCFKSWYKFEGRTRKKIETNFLLFNKFIPAGFWKKFYGMKQMKHDSSITNPNIFFNFSVTMDSIEEWISELEFQNENIIPRWYQIEAVYKAMKYYMTRGDFATGAGKTLIMYLLARYLFEKGVIKKGKKILIVVPSVMLVNQTHEDFTTEYQKDDLLKVDMIYAGSVRTKDANVVVGNIDSLIQRDIDFFSDFDAIFFDEAHKLSTEGYRSIWNYIVPNKLKMVYALSGSWHEKNTIDDLTAESISGPMMMKVTTEQLINEGSLTPVSIKCVKFNYANGPISQGYFMDKRVNNETSRNDGELKYIRSIKKRKIAIGKIASTIDYNQLLLFKSKAYAKEFYEHLKLLCPDKEVKLIIGDISAKEREQIKKFTEVNTNVIICATYGTMSTGVSIKNLSTLHFIEGAKSFIWVRQSIGRILRLHKSKSLAVVYDYSDHIQKPRLIKSEYNKTISSNHLKERKKIYNKQKFPYKEFEVWLEKT